MSGQQFHTAAKITEVKKSDTCFLDFFALYQEASNVNTANPSY